MREWSDSRKLSKCSIIWLMATFVACFAKGDESFAGLCAVFALICYVAGVVCRKIEALEDKIAGHVQAEEGREEAS